LREPSSLPRWFLWATFLHFPSGFVAVLAGWLTAEVGRQPWVVFGCCAPRCRDAEPLERGRGADLADRLCNWSTR
jgi:cytochrome bd-type quinol oxidase subunit 1